MSLQRAAYSKGQARKVVALRLTPQEWAQLQQLANTERSSLANTVYQLYLQGLDASLPKNPKN